MPAHVLSDQKLWFAGYDLTGVMNALSVTDGVGLKEAPVLGNTAMRRLAGLRTVVAQHEGYFQADPEDAALNANMGLVDVPMSFGPIDGAEGSLAYSFASALGEYSPRGEIDEMFRFSLSAEGSAGEPLVRGLLGHNASRTSSANGTAYQLGAAAAGQKLYAALHVLTVSGTNPTLDVTIESDDASGFASAVTRLTFGQATAISSEWASPIAGPITDDWFRVVWAIGGTDTPTFEFVVVFGTQ